MKTSMFIVVVAVLAAMATVLAKPTQQLSVDTRHYGDTSAELDCSRRTAADDDARPVFQQVILCIDVNKKSELMLMRRATASV